MRIYYIPDWVFSALDAAGYGRKDVLNGKVLTDTLSADDVAFLYVIQLRIDEVVPGCILATFPGDRNMLSYDGLLGHLNEHEGLSRAINEYISNGLPEDFTTAPSQLDCELFDENTLVFFPTKKLSECAGMKDPDSIGLRDLLDKTIKAVYSMVAFTELAVTPLMASYIEACQKAVAGK